MEFAIGTLENRFQTEKLFKILLASVAIRSYTASVRGSRM
jgi:hypothetical protein